MNEPSPETEGRKRTFSDRQKVLEEKKMQQQREEAERMRVEEEKRMKRDAKRRERKEREKREAMRIQRIEEQSRNEVSGGSYYGQNYSVHPALTNIKSPPPLVKNKSPSKPSTVIMPEYDAFSEGMTPECIIGATDELGELCFFVKWKGTDDADFVPAKKAKIHCPQLVIRYYENIISWN